MPIYFIIFEEIFRPILLVLTCYYHKHIQYMNFWNYIGGFLLFRWLFGKSAHENAQDSSDCQSSLSDRIFDDDLPIRGSSRYYHGHSYGNPHGWNGQSLNDFHEEQDDYDMMDDF